MKNEDLHESSADGPILGAEQVVLYEEVLEHAREVAQGVEERVRHALDVTSDSFS